jgi:hypothetical protein
LTRSRRFSPEHFLAALSLAIVILMGAAPAGAQPEMAEVQEKARTVLADPRLQRELPSGPQRALAPEGRRSAFPAEDRSPSVTLPVLGAGAFLARIVFVILLVVAVVLIAGWGFREVRMRTRKVSAVGGAAEGAVEEADDQEPSFEDATRLAAEGRYAEAIHALLLAAIRHFAERSRTPVQASRTSRELVRLLPLGAATKEAFTELVGTVELSLFGGLPVGRDEYEQSLSRFRALTRRAA